MSSEARDNTKRFIWIWVALLGLLMLNLTVAYLPLGHYNVLLNMAIAVVKAALVVTFYMHFIETPAIPRLAGLIGVVWVAILLGLSLVDFLTRQIQPGPW